MVRSTRVRSRRRSRNGHALVLGVSLCGLASWVVGGQTSTSSTRPPGEACLPPSYRVYPVAQVLAEARQLAERIGPRPAGSLGERRAAQYLCHRLRQLGYETSLQDGIPLAPGEGVTANVVGRRRGRTPRATVLIGAHYDSVGRDGCPGANDNASGVAVTLELARLLASAELPYDPVFVFFGGEEQRGARSLVGSKYCVAHPPTGCLPAAMLCVDMVGRGPRTVLTGAGPRARELAALIADVGKRQGAPCEIRLRRTGSDHVPFAAAGVPSVWVQRLPDPANHTRRDTCERLEPKALEATVVLLARFLLSFNPGALRSPDGLADRCRIETQVCVRTPDIPGRRSLETNRGPGGFHGRFVRALGHAARHAADGLASGRVAGADTRTQRRRSTGADRERTRREPGVGDDR